MKRKIMIYATAPWVGSGYGKAARYAGATLRNIGWEVAYHGWNAIRGTMLQHEGMTVYPGGASATGVDVLAGHIKHFGADVLLTICDPWMLSDPDLWAINHDAKVVHWHPCQAWPASPYLLEHIAPADLGLNYSRWGTDVMREAGIEHVRFAPLGVDTDTFKPLDKQECKAWLSERVGVDLTSRYVVGIIAANASTIPVGRKNFGGQLAAFKQFQQSYEPDAVMYLHTVLREYDGGIDLRHVLNALDLEVGRDVFLPSYWNMRVGIDDAWMNRALNALDVLSMATLGEGFGLPVVESLAAGVPVVTADNSSLTELSIYGYMAETHHNMWASGKICGWLRVPDTQSIVEGLRAIWANDTGNVLGSREDALEFAAENRWDTLVREHVAPALGSLT